MKKNDYKKIAKEIRKEILTMKFLSKDSHLGSDFSCVDMLTVLYFHSLKINPQKPKDSNRDWFILSKGHSASALYATLALRGFFSREMLSKYCNNGSKLPAHPTKDCVPGVEVSTGSLGHGLPMGLGMALSAKRDGKKNRVFVLMSDGECDEGTTWEAALFASHHKLDSLTVMIDYNKIQSFGDTNDVLNLEPFSQKWKSFGWSVQEINGHDYSDIEKSLDATPFKKGLPSVIIAHTIKGSGGQTACKMFENKLEWHYKSPDAKMYEDAIKLLDQEKN